jgi:hypothetical protein
LWGTSSLVRHIYEEEEEEEVEEGEFHLCRFDALDR